MHFSRLGIVSAVFTMYKARKNNKYAVYDHKVVMQGALMEAGYTSSGVS